MAGLVLRTLQIPIFVGRHRCRARKVSRHQLGSKYKISLYTKNGDAVDGKKSCIRFYSEYVVLTFEVYVAWGSQISDGAGFLPFTIPQ